MQRSSHPPLVSVVIAHHNGVAFLKGCFDALRKTTYPNREIILVDNGSTDDSVVFTRENYPEARIIRSKTNLGFAGGTNLGIREARGEIIVLLNNDTEVTSGWLEPLVEELLSDDKIAACQPKILQLRDRSRFEYAGAAGGFMDRLGYPFLRGRVFAVIEEDRGQYQTPIDLFWTSGAAMAVRKHVLDEVGVLDEDFVLHMEEIDLCWRILLQGYRLRVRPDAVIYHYGGGTLGKGAYRKLYFNHRNSVFMLLKNYSLRRLAWVLPTRLVLDLVLTIKTILTLNLKWTSAVVASYAWLLTHPVVILRKRREVQRRRKVGDGDLDHLLYPGSLVAAYFLRRRRTFDALWARRY